MDVITEYKTKQKELIKQVEGKTIKLDFLPVLQELNYRICVIDTLRQFIVSAPETLNDKVLGYHYSLVQGYIGCLISERKFGTLQGEKEQRETAETTLKNTVSNLFGHFCKPTEKTDYKKNICSLITSVLCVWTQYRDCFIKV